MRDALTGLHRAVFAEKSACDLTEDGAVADCRTRRDARTRQAPVARQRANAPDSGSEVALARRRLGYSGEPAALSPNERAVGRLQAENDPRLRSGGVIILSVPLSIAQ